MAAKLLSFRRELDRRRAVPVRAGIGAGGGQAVSLRNRHDPCQGPHVLRADGDSTAAMMPDTDERQLSWVRSFRCLGAS